MKPGTNRIQYAALIALILLMAACTPNPATLMPTSTILPTEPSQAEDVEEVVTRPAISGEPVPWPVEAINSMNASQVTLLASWGKGLIGGLAWSPDGKTLAISSPTGIYLHNAETLEEIRKIGNGSVLGPMVYSPDGSMLAGVENTTIKLWDTASGSELRTLAGQASEVTSLAFSPDGTLLASGSDYAIIKLWDVAGGNEIATLKGPSENELMGQLIFSTDGTTLVSLGYPVTAFSDGNRGTQGYPALIRIWDIASRTELRTLPECMGYRMALSSDNRSLAVRQENAIAVCDIESGEVLNKLEVTLVNYMAYSPDGTMLVGEVNQALRFWDASTLEEIRTIGKNLEITSMAFSPDWKKVMVSTPSDNAVTLYDAVNGTPLGRLSWPFSAITSVAISPDRSIVAVGKDNGLIDLLDAATGNELLTLTGHTNTISDLAFSPDGATLASASNDKTVKLWEVASGVELFSLEGVRMSYFGGNPSVAYTPDGNVLAYAAWGGRVILWDAVNHRELQTLGGDTTSEYADEIMDIAISPDGKTLASAYGSGSITLWEMTGGRELRTITWHSTNPEGDWVNALVFSPNGKMLVSGSSDNVLTMWDVASGSEIRSLSLSGEIWRLAFLPVGDVLVAGSRAGSLSVMITLVDGSTGGALNALAGGADGLAISADSSVIISASNCGVVKLWGIDPSNVGQGVVLSTSPAVEIVPMATSTQQPTPEDLGVDKKQIPIHFTGENLQYGAWSPDGSYYYFSDQGPIGGPAPDQAISSISFLEARTGKICPSFQETQSFAQTAWGPNPITPSLPERATWLDDNRLLYIGPGGELVTLTPCNDSTEKWNQTVPDSLISFPFTSEVDTTQILARGEQAYWLLTPSTHQSVKLQLPLPPEGQETRFAWSPGHDILLSSRLEERQGNLWIILEKIDPVTGAASLISEISPDSLLIRPMGAFIEYVANDLVLLSTMITDSWLVDISRQPVQSTNLYPDLFKIASSGENISISGSEPGTGKQDYHLYVGTGLSADAKFYLYHAESGLVDELQFTTHLLLVFPNGESVFAQNWINEPASADTVRVIYVDSAIQPHDLAVKGHSPRQTAWLQEEVLPGAEQILFGSAHGISLVDLASGTILDFWELEDQDHYQDLGITVSPDGKTAIGFACQKSSPGEGISIPAMYWLRLEP